MVCGMAAVAVAAAAVMGGGWVSVIWRGIWRNGVAAAWRRGVNR